MSAQQDAHASANVASMEEFLDDLLRDAERLDATLTAAHANVREARDHLRSRLYALRLANDAAFMAEVDDLAQALNAGQRPSTFSLDEVMESQGLK